MNANHTLLTDLQAFTDNNVRGKGRPTVLLYLALLRMRVGYLHVYLVAYRLLPLCKVAHTPTSRIKHTGFW